MFNKSKGLLFIFGAAAAVGAAAAGHSYYVENENEKDHHEKEVPEEIPSKLRTIDVPPPATEAEAKPKKQFEEKMHGALANGGE